LWYTISVSNSRKEGDPIPVSGAAQPCITAGVGIANVNVNALSLPAGRPDLPSINETAFAYQVGFGFTIPLSNTIRLDARYRYFATNVTVNTVFENNRLSSNSVLLGLKIGI
jgi:opacity protein-like surface antigen